MITYEPVGVEHRQFLYELLEERPKEACISHLKMPTFQEHIAYMDSWPSRFKEWHVIRLGEEMIGSAYLTLQNEVGIFIKKEHCGQSIAREAYRWVLMRHKDERLYSNVNPNNKRLIGLLKSLGCKLIQETYLHA